MGRRLLIIALVLIIAISLLVAVKPRLVTNLIIGNELTISLSADNKNLDMINGDSGIVKFDFSVLTNAFCEVECGSAFTDLDKGVIIEKDSFSIRPLTAKHYEVNLLANNTGKGKSFYRFEVSCNAKRSLVCRSNGITKTRGLLIIMNRNFSQEETQNNLAIQQKAEAIYQEINEINSTIEEIKPVVEKYQFDDLDNNLSDISSSISLYASFSTEVNDLWTNQKYDLLESKLTESESSIKIVQNNLNSVKSSFDKKVSAYNNLMIKLNYTYSLLSLIGSGLQNVSNLVIRFNKIAENNSADSIDSLISDINMIDNMSETSTDVALVNKSFNKIKFNYSVAKTFYLNLGKPESECCLFGQCSSCCEQCVNEKFPILLLHGHDFSRDASAEYALDDMDILQRRLESVGFLNAGPLLVGESGEGSLAGPWPVSVKSSYYFDIYKGSDKNALVEMKTDNIDTYAIRLKDTIDVLKMKTNKNKVDIVAHSMGGLVARRYLQIFGTEDVDMLIMVGTPNHGVSSDILTYCYMFGEEKECNDMGADSLLMSKLNNAQRQEIKIYNIIGEGCQMGDETGDGIVKSSSAYLDGAENIIVNGTCNEKNFDFMHVNMIDPDMYPEVYDYIVKYLKKI